MADEEFLSYSQKFVLRNMPGWKLFSKHSNGDVSITFKDKQYRIDKQGTFIGGQEKRPVKQPEKAVQPSLSEDLTAEIHTKPVKVTEKPYVYKPAPTTTLCQEKPECCQTREIKGVFLDADHTIWDMAGTAVSVTGKLRKVDDNTVIEIGDSDWEKHAPKDYYDRWNVLSVATPEEIKGSEGFSDDDDAGYDAYLDKIAKKYNQLEHRQVTGYTLTKAEEELLVGLSSDEKDFLIKELEKEHGVVKSSMPVAKEHVRTVIKLDPTFRPLLDDLDKRKIPVSIISLNTPGSVKRILREFGLEHRFVEIRDSYESKGRVFSELTHAQGMCPCAGLFVDDNRSNTETVFDHCGMSIQIGKNKDIEKIGDLVNYIK